MVHGLVRPATGTYPVEQVQVQNLPLHVRNLRSASLQLPELCYLIEEIELDSGLSLKLGGRKSFCYAVVKQTCDHLWDTGKKKKHSLGLYLNIFSKIP